MADAAVDVKFSAVAQVELPRRVAAVAHGKQRRRQEWRLALTTVGMAGEDPALEVRPAGKIAGVRVMTEREDGFTGPNAGQHALGSESAAPQVVETDDFQPGDDRGLVA